MFRCFQVYRFTDKVCHTRVSNGKDKTMRFFRWLRLLFTLPPETDEQWWERQI